MRGAPKLLGVICEEVGWSEVEVDVSQEAEVQVSEERALRALEPSFEVQLSEGGEVQVSKERALRAELSFQVQLSAWAR